MPAKSNRPPSAYSLPCHASFYTAHLETHMMPEVWPGVQAAGAGQLQVTFAGSPAGNSSSCSAGIEWPSVDTIDVLGLSNIDTSSVALTVSPVVSSLILLPDAEVVCRRRSMYCVLSKVTGSRTLSVPGRVRRMCLPHGTARRHGGTELACHASHSLACPHTTCSVSRAGEAVLRPLHEQPSFRPSSCSAKF